MTNDEIFPFDQGELSPEDLAVLQAFDAMDWDSHTSDINEAPSTSEKSPSEPSLPLENDADFLQEMMALFLTEVEEDLASMQHSWSLLDQTEQLRADQFSPFRRGGHKIRGSAGAVNCTSIITIAGYIEDTSELIMLNQLSPDIGLHVLSLSLSALSETLQSIVTTGSEDATPLARLSSPMEAVRSAISTEPLTTDACIPSMAEDEPLFKEDEIFTAPLFPIPGTIGDRSLLRVEPSRVEQLLVHSQQLTEMRASLESSQAQMSQALQELHIAQTRLHQLQSMLSTLSTPNTPRSPMLDEHSSSLVTRILANADQNDSSSNRTHKRRISGQRARNASLSAMWDELDIEHYSEQDLLLRSLSEAITDISLISARVQSAAEQRELLLQHYMLQATQVHHGVLQLRLVPLHLLLPGLRRFLQRLSDQTTQHFEFDVQGESVEVDEKIIEIIAPPFLRFIQACLSDRPLTSPSESSQPLRIWFHAQLIGNEIALEIGFSFPVNGGAFDAIREPLQRLNGSFSPGRNSSNGVSFHLRFPRAQGGAHCLLVRVGSERFIIPIAQIQRISDRSQESLHTIYDLGTLLGFSSSTSEDARIHPVLILPAANSPTLLGVMVDEVIDELEFVVKPLQSYLQRPGITCSTVDGRGSVLLQLDLPELIRHYMLYTRKKHVRKASTQSQQSDTAKILIADDSVSIRQSLRQTLTWAHYTIFEARDGIIALEQLLEHSPDILLLDVEMPNLNGYDLLRTMRLYPQLAHVKTIILTSRSSEKHKNQAKELGIQRYMTKPVVPEVLLSSIKELLSS